MAQQALVDLLLSEKGNFIQTTILDESAKFLDASFRDTYSKARESQPAKLMFSLLESQNKFADSIAQVPLFGSALVNININLL